MSTRETREEGKGARPLPYGLSVEQVMTLTSAPRRLLDAAEALLMYTPAHEHAVQARHEAELIRAAFPEIESYWQAAVEDALRERDMRRC